jgi:uncharacterized membrane protein (TIGR01666 family)
LFNNKTTNYSLLIFATLIGVILPCWYLDKLELITPLVLGVIAAALAETDDNFFGRIKALILTFICFAIATISIELLFPYPILFAIGLFASTFGFIMLGAIGPRYASIAFGSLLIAIYTMLGAWASESWWEQPKLLLAGAAWYYLLSMIWQTIWPMKPVQNSLSNTFLQLAHYLDSKAQLFHPITGLEPQPHRIKEAHLNANTVTALNACKETLLSRSKRGVVDGPSDRFLNVYFVAQDIHERISSTHYRYQELSKHFSHSDVLFRFKYLLQAQANACRDIAASILNGHFYDHNKSTTLALDELQQSMLYIEKQNNPEWRSLIPQLNYLFKNLCTVENQLSSMNNPDVEESAEESQLIDSQPHSIKPMLQRIGSNLNLNSLLFRHAIRLATALTLGYGVIQLFNFDHGYWILLTILFVCQPNFSATRKKLKSRVIGTLSGLIVGVVLLSILPSVQGQLIVIVLSGILFFALRVNNYAYATTFITILVLFCFAQLGEGFAVILPRLVDTLVGCAIAIFSITYILPDWQSKRLPVIMSNAITSNAHYLDQIIGQYRVGKKNNLQYRVARREAHNFDAQLSTAISSMLVEPNRYRTKIDESFRFLTLNHALLSYISTLGAHRQRIDEETTHRLILDAHLVIRKHLLQIASSVNKQSLTDSSNSADVDEIDREKIEHGLSLWREDDSSSARLILQQLHLVYRMLPEMHALSKSLGLNSIKSIK